MPLHLAALNDHLDVVTALAEMVRIHFVIYYGLQFQPSICLLPSIEANNSYM